MRFRARVEIFADSRVDAISLCLRLSSRLVRMCGKEKFHAVEVSLEFKEDVVGTEASSGKVKAHSYNSMNSNGSKRKEIRKAPTQCSSKSRKPPREDFIPSFDLPGRCNIPYPPASKSEST
jgi:hypothetical protein